MVRDGAGDMTVGRNLDFTTVDNDNELWWWWCNKYESSPDFGLVRMLTACFSAAEDLLDLHGTAAMTRRDVEPPAGLGDRDCVAGDAWYHSCLQPGK